MTDLQKANLTKRISAFLFDGILLAVLILGIALVLSWAIGFENHYDTMQACRDKYAAEYGINLKLTEEEYNQFTQEQKDAYLAAVEAADKALQSDEAAVHAGNMMLSLALVILSGSILLGYLILEFAVPLWLGNGQTLGKKVFGIAVMRVDGVKINAVTLFVRTVLGKFTIETMVPVLLLIMSLFFVGLIGIVIVGLILLLQVIVLIVTRTNSLIHDLLANTVTVDMASQRIFENDLELIAYKERMQAEKAARQAY